MKKTPWFPASVNPVRKGWYEVRYHQRLFGVCEIVEKVKRLYWTGTDWYARNSDRGRAIMDDAYGDQWRGLMK